MALRRPALAAVLTALALAAPACRFSRTNNTALPSTSSSESTVAIFGDDTSTSIEDTTTTAVATSTIKGAVTTRKPTSATTAKPAPAPTAAPTVPHCTVSTPDTFYGSSWTASVASTFPDSTVVVDLSWSGGSGNYSGVTDSGGSYSKTQRVQPSMRNQTVQVHVSVGGRTCSSSFKVS